MATVFTSVGENVVTDYITGDAAAPVSYYIGWGSGAGAAGKGSIDLSTPEPEARVSAVETQPATDKAQWVSTITCAGAPKTITNAGLFDAAGVGSPPAGGNLIIVGDGIATALNVSDKIEFTITLEQT